MRNNLRASPIRYHVHLLSLLATLLLAQNADRAFAQFPPDVDLSQISADVAVSGAASSFRTGAAVAGADVDGDARQDLVIFSQGGPLSNWAAFTYLLWGSVPWDSLIDFLGYAGAYSTLLAGNNETGDFAGLATGDFNNDGYDDVAMGLPFAGSGKVYITFGASSLPDTVFLSGSNPNVTTLYGGTGAWLGTRMASGDVNGDDYDDLIIGAPNFWPGGRVYVLYGRASFPAVMQLDTAPNVTRIIDSYVYRGTGWGLACDDVDGDGLDDLLIGSPGNADGFYEGTVTVLMGNATLPATIYLFDGMSNAKRFHGEYSHGQLGWTVAVGNVVGDNSMELILSAHMADPLGCDNCGEVYIVTWDESLPDSIHVATNQVPITRLIGEGTLQHYGLEITCSDVTADGHDDLAVTSEPDDFDASDVGNVTLVYGSTTLPDSLFLGTDTTVTRFYAEARQANFGHGLASADFDGDGVSDLCIGAFRANPFGRISAGRVYLFYGMSILTGIATPIPRVAWTPANFPNPFSGSTTIEYYLSEPGSVTLTVYNALGQRVAEVMRPFQPVGPQKIAWNGVDDGGRRLPSGVYFCRLQAGQSSQTRKIVIVR